MDIAIALKQIANHGLQITVMDGCLHVRPRELITDAIRETIRKQKTALVDFLNAYQERATPASGPSNVEGPVPSRQLISYRLRHLKDNWPLFWCWFAIVEPDYVREFADLSPVPPNEIYRSGHKTEAEALAFGERNGMTRRVET